MAKFELLQFARDVLRQSSRLSEAAYASMLQFARDVLRQSFRCSGITDHFRAVFLYSESC